MPDRRMNVTLAFATDAPPHAVAMQVGNAVTSEVPDQLEAITWHGFDLDEEARNGDAG